jgi:aspartate-semialdehyde dehydrogenase
MITTAIIGHQIMKIAFTAHRSAVFYPRSKKLCIELPTKPMVKLIQFAFCLGII